MMKKLLALAIGLMLIAGLSACGQTDEKLYVYNWGEYLSDGVYGDRDNLAAFEEYYEEITGRSIKVYYTTYPSNEDMYAKVSSGTSIYDVIFPSDYMVERLIAEDLLLPINIEEVCDELGAECYYDTVTEDFRGLYYDPEDKYSVPYTYGRVGIIYNTTMVDEEDCTGWEILWNDKYAGKILQFNNARDAFSTVQYMLGIDVNTTDPADWELVYEKMLEQKEIIQSYVMDEIYNKMESGEAAVAAYYAGDYFTMLEVNEDLGFFYPEETNIFVDCMCIPKGSGNPKAAAMFINYMLKDEAAIPNAECLFYASPHKCVYTDEDYIEEMGEEVMEVLYPEDFNFREQLNKYAFRNLDPETAELVNGLWEELKIEGGLPDSIYITAGILAALIAAAVIGILVRNRRRAKWY